MTIRDVRLLSVTMDMKKLPGVKYPEFAFIGRSNVGKSSLINALLGRKELARVSSTPGKTQTINHFLVNDSWCLVDLPGYGYAKTSASKRITWLNTVNRFISSRESLVETFVLVDSRIAPQQSDISFINKLGEKAIPFVIVFTKCDKLKKEALQKVTEIYKDALSERWEEFPRMFLTSAEKKTGLEEILSEIGSMTGSEA